ncbi:hypothetical protein N9E11_01455 [Crocinitomicaceae bacterium]|nr:hypothetical protein [Crocinitomicaceae bacterium]MDB4606299.1 hypothetical protein [Crocinitomicaceae bacterium]
MKKFIYILFIFLVSACGQSIEEQVAQKEIENYNMALKGGDPIEIAMEAMLVAEMFKQAGDQENYLKWKKISKEADKAAGMDFE